jgi:hypothetical protein
MTWADDDAAELAARRHAAHLRDTCPPAPLKAGRAVPVRAQAPGHDFALEPVGPGWTIYSTATIDSALDPAGVVVEVIHRQAVDEDTGEINANTVYRCLRYWTPSAPSVYVDAGDVDVTQLTGVDRRSASAAVRWLVRPLVARRRGVQLTGREIEAIHDAWRLAAAVAVFV